MEELQNKINSTLFEQIIFLIHPTQLKLSAVLFVAVKVAHGDTTDVSQVLSVAFLLAMPPYSLASLQWQPNDK